MLKRLAVGLFGAAVCLPFCMAQMRVSGMSLPFARGSAPFASPNHFAIGFRGRRARLSRGIAAGSPFWYGDYFPESAVTEATEPEVVVLQTQAPPQAPAPEAKLPEPLLIELQGGHYVRLRGSDAAQQGFSAQADYAKAVSPKSAIAAKHSPPPKPKSTTLAPVELIYRDGRHADVHDYTIVDGTIYARGDYWTDGYWEKKIQISSLNVPATIKENQEHGVKFVLPSSPDEVVTRP